MLISSHFNRLNPYRQWDQPSLAEREAERSTVIDPAANPARDKTSQAPFTPRPVLDPEEAERFSRRHARPSTTESTLAVEEQSPQALQALDAYHDVSTTEEREYVRSVFGVDIYA